MSHSATSHSLNELEARLSGSLDNNLAGRLPDAGTVAAADSRARHWRYPHPGRLRPGSPEHKAAMCAMFAETFNPYKPSVIAWPKLEPEALHRIVSLPIWDIAVQTEGKARLRMSAYAETLSDPEMREAIARNGWEENRHKEVLSKLVEAYGIQLAPEPEYVSPKDPEWAYMLTGFSECVDSFFAFGLFEMARQSGFFPEELVETFEPVMQEECRHILLFANWLAWHRATMPLWRRPWFELRVWAAWIYLGYDRMGIAKQVDGDDKAAAQGQTKGEQKKGQNFTMTSGKAMAAREYSVAEIMDLCLAENDRRFLGYDERLLRPVTMPWLVRLARRFMRTPKAA